MSVQKGTKYGPTHYNPCNRSSRWKWEYEQGNPRMTDHVLEQWDKRTPDDYYSPEHAWEHGVDVSDLRYAFQDNGGQIPAEARYYYDSETDVGVVLLVSDGVVKTVYKEGFIDPVAQAMLEGVRRLMA